MQYFKTSTRFRKFHVAERLRSFSLFILLLLAGAASPQAEETSDTLPEDSLHLTLGKVVVVGKAPGRDVYNLPTSVDIVAADKLENENVDFSLELAKKVPGVLTSDFNQVYNIDISKEAMHKKFTSEAVNRKSKNYY